MSMLRRMAALMVMSIKPGFLIAGALALLALLLVAVIVKTAVYSPDKNRRQDAQRVLQTLFRRPR